MIKPKTKWKTKKANHIVTVISSDKKEVVYKDKKDIQYILSVYDFLRIHKFKSNG